MVPYFDFLTGGFQPWKTTTGKNIVIDGWLNGLLPLNAIFNISNVSVT
jgi:hypothetical protein